MAKDVDGGEQTHVGLEVCRGPAILRMLLTRPYGAAGRIIEVPLDRVESVDTVERSAPTGGTSPPASTETNEPPHPPGPEPPALRR